MRKPHTDQHRQNITGWSLLPLTMSPKESMQPSSGRIWFRSLIAPQSLPGASLNRCTRPSVLPVSMSAYWTSAMTPKATIRGSESRTGCKQSRRKRACQPRQQSPLPCQDQYPFFRLDGSRACCCRWALRSRGQSMYHGLGTDLFNNGEDV